MVNLKRIIFMKEIACYVNNAENFEFHKGYEKAYIRILKRLQKAKGI